MDKNSIERILLEKAVNASSDGIVISDNTREDNPLIFVNPAFERLTGYTAEEVIGKNCRFLQGNEKNQPELDILRNAMKQGTSCLIKLKNFHKDGTMFWNELSISPVKDRSGAITNFIGVQKDITKRVEAEEQLRRKKEALEETNRRMLYAIERDSATGLFSRDYFEDRSRKMLAETGKGTRRPSLTLLNIDFFRSYNDTEGRAPGNTVLKGTGKAVQGIFNSATDIAARYGGGQFAVFSLAEDENEAERKAAEAVEEVRNLKIPHERNPPEKIITVSAGVAVLSPGEDNLMDKLFSMAEDALIRARKKGGGQVVVNQNSIK